ncbi:MAG: O-antigen ligase family protein [Microthrixaceae bacterium]|nr:O-antigen ligase family protein [Microthrixaceae bacterium]
MATALLPTEALLAAFGLLIVGAGLVRSHHDTTLMILLLLTVMAVVPAPLAIPELGSLGTPTTLIGLAAGGLWFVSWAWSRREAETLVEGHRPIPILLGIWLASVLASFAVASMRAKDGLEASAADRGVVTVLAAVGIALLIAETVPTRERLDAIIRVVVLAGSIVALVGILQFTTGVDLAADVRLPGFERVGGALSVTERSIFRRVAGTTLHPIEFGVVMCLCIPPALHLAMHHSRRWFLAVAVMGLALPMSVSRTAVPGVVAAAIVLVPAWPRKVRRRFLLGAAGYLVAVRLFIPGLLGTIRALFVDAPTDPSINSRESDYEFVSRFVGESPMLGRGFSTFIPTRYDFLDNQYLLSLVETGVVGLLALLTLIVGGMVTAASVRGRTDNEVDRDLAQALMASLAVVAATSAAYDYLSFPTTRVLMFVVLGCVGALWRLVPRGDPATSVNDSPPVADEG